ncbi:MAG: FtsW/RodA/SpoVE family cell cycle protein [Patescibacteria group bacterium]
MNRSYFRVDLSLLIPAVVLVILGISGIFSLNFDLFKLQIVFFFASILIFFFFSQVNYQNIKNLSIPIYIISIILLAVVLFVGTESRGSVRWIGFFGRGIQFSEILKPFLALALASFLAHKENYSVKNFLTILLLILPIFILIFLQPDLGNALIYFFTAILVLFSFGFPIRYLLTLFVLGAVSMPVFWQFLRTYQKQRVLTFLQLKVDPLGSSYNAIQSVIAVGSGMILGKGFGQGTQSILRFLPERHTDFIFATLSEELGLVGSVLIISTFSFLLYRILIISKKTNDSFIKIFSMSVFFLIAVQFFVNAGMNIGIVPIVGVSLPFVSYGGSSLVANFILLGFLSSMSKDVRKDTLEIK